MSRIPGQGSVWLLVAVTCAFLIAVMGCAPDENIECIQFDQAECYTQQGTDPRPDIADGIVTEVCYPIQVNLGKSTQVQIDVSNQSSHRWDRIYVDFASSVAPAGEPYFTGFSLETVDPSPSRAYARSDFVQLWWDSYAILPGDQALLRITLKAIRPAVLGTRLKTQLQSEDVFCFVKHIIYTAVR